MGIILGKFFFQKTKNPRLKLNVTLWGGGKKEKSWETKIGKIYTKFQKEIAKEKSNGEKKMEKK